MQLHRVQQLFTLRLKEEESVQYFIVHPNLSIPYRTQKNFLLILRIFAEFLMTWFMTIEFGRLRCGEALEI